MERLTEQRIGELEKMHGASPAGVLMVATPVPEEFGQPPYGIMRHLGGDQIRCEATVQNKSLADSFAALHNNFPSLAAEARKGLLAEKYRKALEQARGALRLDHMVDSDGKPFGTTTVALEAIDDALGGGAA